MVWFLDWSLPSTHISSSNNCSSLKYQISCLDLDLDEFNSIGEICNALRTFSSNFVWSSNPNSKRRWFCKSQYLLLVWLLESSTLHPFVCYNEHVFWLSKCDTYTHRRGPSWCRIFLFIHIISTCTHLLGILCGINVRFQFSEILIWPINSRILSTWTPNPNCKPQSFNTWHHLKESWNHRNSRKFCVSKKRNEE